MKPSHPYLWQSLKGERKQRKWYILWVPRWLKVWPQKGNSREGRHYRNRRITQVRWQGMTSIRLHLIDFVKLRSVSSKKHSWMGFPWNSKAFLFSCRYVLLIQLFSQKCLTFHLVMEQNGFCIFRNVCTYSS